MSIRVIEEPEVVVTQSEWRRYWQEYERFCRYHVNPPSLSEYIRRCKLADPRDDDPTKEGIFRSHNCYRCKDGALPCVKGKGNERECDTLRARND